MTPKNHPNDASNHLPCDELHDLLPSYVLGITDDEESRYVEALMLECADYEHELQAYENVKEALLYSVPTMNPPDHLRQRILDEARRTAREPAHSTAHDAESFTPRIVPAAQTKRRNLALIAAVVTLVLLNVALMASTFNLQVQQQASSAQVEAQIAMLDMVAENRAVQFDMHPFSPEAPEDANGLVLCNPDERAAFVRVRNMPTTQKDYQVWLLRDGEEAERGGIFRVDGYGNGSLAFQAQNPMGMYQYIGVSVKIEHDTPENYETPLITAALYIDPE